MIVPEPIVSVVIPTYKLAHLLPFTLTSLKNQVLDQFEAIVLDDGSPDDTLSAMKCVKDDPRFKYVRQPNRGLPGARNAGYRYCSTHSRYVYFLDADDVVEPSALCELTAYLDSNPTVGMAYCAMKHIDETGQDLRIPAIQRGWKYGPKAIGRNEALCPLEAIYTLSAPIICSIALLRRSVFDKTGGFDESFGHHREDTNVFIKMALLADVHFLNKCLVGYRIRAGQMSSDAAGLNAQATKLYEHWSTRPDLTPDERRRVEEAEKFRVSREFEFVRATHSGRELLRSRRFVMGARVLVGALRNRYMSTGR